MSGDAHYFNNIETRVVIKEIHANMTETLEEHAPSYATVKNWVDRFDMVIFPSVLRIVLDDSKQ